jgi:hypothetical protein
MSSRIDDLLDHIAALEREGDDCEHFLQLGFVMTSAATWRRAA